MTDFKLPTPQRHKPLVIDVSEMYGPNRSMMISADNGVPVRVLAVHRASTTAHGRLKVALAFPTEPEADGPLCAVAVASFRLEMN